MQNTPFLAKSGKNIGDSNPIIAPIYCADPTAVEFNGRLYLYGTNDHQQYLADGAEVDNKYDKIRSLVVLSTDDMVNWTYHGTIEVGEIAPWIIASWAPSIVSREENDGTHFYLYFSNSGFGTGVLTATSPLGPWSDPLGHSLVDKNTPGLELCEAPFDPGAAVEENGTGWLTFGGGSPNAQGSARDPGNTCIVRLGSDMISLGSEMIRLDAPYHFEANELNIIGGKYVYTYNTSWQERDVWEKSVRAPAICSMAYMTSDTPLDASSWQYHDFYLRNPGQMGMYDCNNHTHLHKYAGRWYLFYHALFPMRALGHKGGFRSMCVEEIELDEGNVRLGEITATRRGPAQLKPFDASSWVSGCTMSNGAAIEFITDGGEATAVNASCGAWICLRGVDLRNTPCAFSALVCGQGKLSVHLDQPDGECLAEIESLGEEYCERSTACNAVSPGGIRDIWLLLSEGVCLARWRLDYSV